MQVDGWMEWCVPLPLQVQVRSSGLALTPDLAAAGGAQVRHGWAGDSASTPASSSCVRESIHVEWNASLLDAVSGKSDGGGSGGGGAGSSGHLQAALQLVGPHQHANVAAAVSAALLLRREGWGAISDEAIASGLSNAMLPGRFQVSHYCAQVWRRFACCP